MYATVEIPPQATSISFEYRFPQIGEGDYASVQLDDIPIWTIAAENAVGNEFVDSGPRPISVGPGPHKLTIALYGVGEKNSEFELRGLVARYVTETPVDGDVDGDRDIDRNDIALITAARNQPASGPNDRRDLNKDSVINALDARIAATRCTRPSCAVN
jgi:hypothetical protein